MGVVGEGDGGWGDSAKLAMASKVFGSEAGNGDTWEKLSKRRMVG